LRILDEKYKGSLRGCLGKKSEGSKANEIDVWAVAICDSESTLESASLRVRQSIDVRQKRPHQLMKASERQPCLRLHASRARYHHANRGGVVGRGLQQRGLANSCIASDNQRAAAMRRVVNKPKDLRQLPISADEFLSRRICEFCVHGLHAQSVTFLRCGGAAAGLVEPHSA
jgi:hypothetical protein